MRGILRLAGRVVRTTHRGRPGGNAAIPGRAGLVDAVGLDARTRPPHDPAKLARD
jgi:hypothetical protein